MTKYDEMKKIRDELLVFKQSPLFEYRTTNKFFPVVGEGSHDAKIMFVGEAPGLNEAKQGRPFCGASGKFLTELVGSIGLTREEVYVTNVVKDRPPDNRDPTQEEIEIYAPFLVRQIETIKPKVVATLGRHSMNFVMRHFDLDLELEPISRIHGQVFNATSSFGPIFIATLYHPAAALYNGSMRDTLKTDFEILKKYV